MERALYISKYRNIGFEKDERIVLNNSLEKGKMGNLVILVGANNSGKSNVLAALNSFSKQLLTERDLTTLSYDEKSQKPTLSLCSKDGKNEFYYRIGYNIPLEFGYPNNIEFNYAEHFNILVEFIVDLNKDVLYRVGNYSHYSFINDTKKLLTSKPLDSKEIEKIFGEFLTKYNQIIKNNSTIIDTVMKIINQDKYLLLKDLILKNIYNNPIEKINIEYKKIYEMNFIPNIINYIEKPISNTHTMVSIKNISESEFLNKIFKKIDISITELENIYKAFEKHKNSGVFVTFENKVNKKLEIIANDFNKLYYVEDDKYSFKIRLEKDTIYFNIYHGSKDIVLDYQSTGFKWFFNIYFNLLTESKLEPGDIIVMDEPATNLHVSGQVELRKFLKKFALDNDLTIILATHSPFLIDLDYLDELRVVSNKDNYASICNDFTTVDLDDPDSIKPIKNALTIHNHVLVDYDKEVIFVEGITDYNYLLTFKKILKIEKDIVFLPIKGVGKTSNPDFKDQQVNISKALIKIRKNNPILLVDNDRAGKEIKKLNEKNSSLSVISLNEIDEKFKFIEDLFSSEDLTKLGLIDNKGKKIKCSSLSAIIKTFYDKYEFSNETLNNFKKVFEYFSSL